MKQLTITVSEASRILGLSRPMIYTKLLNDPSFPAFRVGNRWLISTEGLHQWIANQTTFPLENEIKTETTR